MIVQPNRSTGAGGFLLGIILSVALVPSIILAQPTAPGKIPVDYGRFAELPVGAVQPRGWIKHWLEQQAAGLTGHPENLAYPYDTCLFTGKIPPPPVKHGEAWWPYEQTGYLVDAVVRLNHLVRAGNVSTLAEKNLAALRENSGPGKFGESTWGWPNAVVGRAVLAEHSATQEKRYVDLLRDYFREPRPWNSRDGFVFEQALYLHRQTGDVALLDFARDAARRFFQDDPKSFSHVEKLSGDAPLREHGVTAAEQLKLLPMLFSATGEEEFLRLANLVYRKVEAASLMPDGGMVSSENLGPTAFNSLHESCDLTDWPWSIGYLLLAGGEAHWADLIEQTTFNALPGAVTKDFKQLQYFSSANQVLASNTACPRIAPTRMSYRAAHETECCSGNISRAMPNYVSRMWLKSNDGLAAALYGPSEIRTTIAGKQIRIVEETDYPFRETLTFTVTADQPVAFALSLRIPEWCLEASIAINGAASSLSCLPGTFAKLERTFQNGDVVTLRLPMKVKWQTWFEGAAASVKRGPLVYSLPVPERRVESFEDTPAIRVVLKGNNILGFPAVEFFPAGEWRYSLASQTLSGEQGIRVIESPLTENPFAASVPPVQIEVPLRPLPHWAEAWQPLAKPDLTNLKDAPKNPASLPTVDELKQSGSPELIKLVPYGCTHLRLTTFPLISNP